MVITTTDNVFNTHDFAGEVVGRKGAAQETGQGDADLNGGQEARGLLHHFEHLSGLAVALFGLLAQFVLIKRDDGDFGGCEEGVNGDQHHLKQQLTPYRVR